MTKTKGIEEYHVGDRAEVRHTITAEDMQTFANLTGDHNPLHLDDDFARETSFKKPVVYGMLSASFISTLIGMKIPGPGALWTSQTIKFLRQVYVGDTIFVDAVIEQISVSTHTMVLKISAQNQNHQPILDGEATVQVLEVAKKIDENAAEKRERVCLITGGSSDIGGEIAQELLSKGYSVALHYGKSRSKAEAIVKRCSSPGKIEMYQSDLCDMDATKRMLDAISSELGQITDVVHSAAPHNTPQSFLDMDWPLFDKQIQTQVKGFFGCMQVVLPAMLKENIAGRIVAISSIAVDDAPPLHQHDYVTGKAALSALVKSLAVEYSPKGIAFNMVAPGMAETSRIADLPQKAKLLTKMQSPARRLAQPQEIAKAVAFLLGQESCVLTGETLRICGGLHMI